MTIDMRQFHQVFFEEASEHIEAMESILLVLDIAAPDKEQLNAIFRAAHSIKGSSATFGFTDMQDVTHILENLLDSIRKGRLPLRKEMIEVFLDTVDVLKNLLAAHQSESETDEDAVKAICQRLSQLTEAKNKTAPTLASKAVKPVAVQAPPAVEGTVAVKVAAAEMAAPSVAQVVHEVYFTTVENDANAAEAVENLLQLISLQCEADIVARPDVSSRLWHLRTRGCDNEQELRAMLEFIADTDSIRIEPQTAAPESMDGPTVDLNKDDAENAYGFFEPLEEVVDKAAAAEAVVKSKPTASADTSIRVGVGKVDQLINLVGELVITQAMLAQSVLALDEAEFERLHTGLTQLQRNTRDLQEAVMSIRMMPMSVVFSRFPRVVHDLSNKLGKQVELKLSGESTELDKGLTERIIDPLTHLLRNGLDHGIELPEVRAEKGKPAVGTITLSAYHQGGNVVIEVGDDGAGLERDKILAKAKERGLNVHDQMSDREVFDLIFEAGFSTVDQVTEVSGRGVGMDVVKKNISAMGGSVDIESMPGLGTRITVRLPLTLAILDGMSVTVGKETYIIPLGYVIESFQAEAGMIKSISGVESLIRVRDEYLPIVKLNEVFNVRGALTRVCEGIVVVLEANGSKAALFVDALGGQQQVVIKSLESNYRKVAGISGATIMGDGRVALILDVSMLISMAQQKAAAA